MLEIAGRTDELMDAGDRYVEAETEESDAGGCREMLDAGGRLVAVRWKWSGSGVG